MHLCVCDLLGSRQRVAGGNALWQMTAQMPDWGTSGREVGGGTAGRAAGIRSPYTSLLWPPHFRPAGAVQGRGCGGLCILRPHLQGAART